MPGSYPRTENDIIKIEKIEIAEKIDKTISDIAKSVDYPNENRPQIKFRVTHRGEVKTYKVYKQPSESLKDRVFVDTPHYGKVDISRIDGAGTISADSGNVNYKLMAQLEINNPDNNLPNFEKFCQREDIARLDMPIKVEKYLDFRTAIAHKNEIEHTTGIRIDITNLKDPVEATDILKDPQTVSAFQISMDIGVSRDFMKGVVLIDLERKGREKQVERVRNDILKDLRNDRINPLLYNPNDRKMYIILNFVTPDLIINGGLFHEKFHAKRHQEMGDIDAQLGLTQGHPAIQIIKSCEEAAENIQTSRFMGENKSYNEQLYNRYLEDPRNIPFSADRLVWRKEPEKIAEAMATFKETEPQIFNVFKSRLDIDTYKKEFGKGRVDKVYGLVNNFYKAADSNDQFKESVMSSINLMGIDISNSKGNTKPRFKKFSSYTLEERLF